MVSEPDSPRDRLIQTVLDLLVAEGLEGLSLRSIARRAGVSHGAPLRHFASLADLLSEVAAHGFRMLSEAIEKSAAQLAPGVGPLARLRAGSRAYVECAVANPALFALMFRPELLDADNASYRRDGGAAFERVVVQVRAAQDAGWHPQRDTRCSPAPCGRRCTASPRSGRRGAQRTGSPASLEDALTTALESRDDGAPGGSDDRESLPVGQLRPVADEHTASDLRVTGHIPRRSRRLLRIGPNPIAPDPRATTGSSATAWCTAWRCAAGARPVRSRFVRDDEVVAASGLAAGARPQREDPARRRHRQST